MTDRAGEEICRFWFEELGPSAWWDADADVDRKIAERLGAYHGEAVAGRIGHWADTAIGALALILLLDQVSRNLGRGEPAAYDHDAAAQAVAKKAIANRQDLECPYAWRQFFYMPLMHAEDLAAQDACVRFCRDRLPGDATAMDFARHHRDIIARFGRFPHRNRVLGRPSTPEEEAWLAAGGFNPGT